MSKRVLSIGNCSNDNFTLSSALEKIFPVELQSVDTAEEARQVLTKNQFDLVLVNRLFDINGDSGIDLIKKLKPTVKATFMLLSNYPEYQQEAIAAGAVQGFGKTAVGKPAMIEAVGEYLR